MRKKHHSAGKIDNQRARFDYEIKDSFLAGMALSGAEVKSLRLGHGSLAGSFVNLKNNEAWLINAQIMPIKTNLMNLPSEVQSRARKLLLKKSELAALQAAKQQGLTIVPLKLLTRGRYIKVEIATARGKRKYDKRETIKRRDQQRDMARLV